MADEIRPARPIRSAVIVLLIVASVLGLGAWAALAVRKPDDHWNQVTRARSFLERGRPDLAFQEVSGIRDEAPGAAEALVIAARAMLHFGNIPTARRSLERSLALQPKQPEAARMLAAIYLASGDGPRGARLLEQAAEQDPHDFRARFALGKVYHDLGELAKSAEAYAEAIKRKPPEPEATQSRIGRIRALLDANLQGEATADLEAALREAPENAEILGLAARQFADLGRAAEARELADRALRAAPENFDARLVRARLRFLDGQLEPALEDLAAARAINPNHLGALQLQAQVQARAGRADEAERTREEFRQARERLELMDRLTREISRNPDDPEPRWRMGQAAAEGRMGTLALQCYQAALDIDPGYQPAREGLARLRESGLLPETAAGLPSMAR